MARVHGKTPKKTHTETKDKETPMDNMQHAVAKLTVSVKRRLSNGDEVFIAPGIEIGCAPGELDETQEDVATRVNDWVTKLLEDYPDDDSDDETEDDEEATEDEHGGGEDEDEDEEVTEADIRKMKKAELLDFIEENELEIETKGASVKSLRDDIIEALLEDDEDEDEDGGDDETEDDEDEDYEKEELDAMPLSELQGIADQWELKVRVKPGSKLSAKKAAYTKAILKAQDE